jgi:hypothetical protein
MKGSLGSRGALLATALTVGLMLGALALGSPPAHGQSMGDIPSRTYRFAPVLVAPDEILKVAYSNVFGKVPTVLSVSFIDANYGTFLGGLKDVVVAPGTGESVEFPASSNLVVIAIVQLAESRSTPFLSLQLIANGSAAWLAEPRPDPTIPFPWTF